MKKEQKQHTPTRGRERNDAHKKIRPKKERKKRKKRGREEQGKQLG